MQTPSTTPPQNMSSDSEAKTGSFFRFEQGINNENQYLNLFLQALVPIGILRGADFVVELANDAILKIWGKDSDILGKTILEALPEIRDTQYPVLLEKVYSTGVSHYAYESSATLIRNGNPEKVYFNFVYQPLYGQDFRISGVMVIANEVTDQVLARRLVEASEKKFRSLILESEVATGVYTGPDMTIELANDAMLRLWGKGASVIGKTISEALPELEGQPFPGLLKRVYTTGATYRATEDRCDLMIDGRLQTFYFNFSYKPMYNAEGEIYGILNMAVDVTELVRARQELVQIQERMNLAADISGLGSWDIFPGSDRLVWDDRSRELFGFGPGQEIATAQFNSLVLPEDVERVWQGFQWALSPQSDGNIDQEFRIRRFSDRQLRHLRSRGKVFFDASRNPERIAGSLQDITDQKEKAAILEQKIRERTSELQATNERLRLSNQELEQFAHVASHDMKEPVRKAKIFCSRLSTEFGHLLPEKANQYLQKIDGATNRMTTMVDGVLNYSTLSSTMHLLETINLRKVLQQIEEDLELIIDQKKAVLEYGELPHFEGAPVLIYQLFYNLINNSFKFSRTGVPPRITICGSVLPAADGQKEKRIVLELRDNGIGFEQKYAEVIFQTFSRLHPRDQYEGTGLGLALCKQIVTRHNGTIRAEGKPGDGACFTIVLPQHQPANR